MKNYELALIVSAELTSQEIEKKLEKLRKEISKVAKITSEDIWGLRDLAYRIKLQEKGFYAIFYVEGKAGCLDEIEGEMRIDPQYLRYMVINREEGYVPNVRLEEEGEPVKKEEIKKKVDAAKAQKVVKVEKEEVAEVEVEEKKIEKVKEKEVKEEVKEEKIEEKEEIVEEKKTEEKEEEIEKEESDMKKKVAPKKKSSLDDLDAALDELLKD